VCGGGTESADEDEVRRPDPVAPARVVGSGVRAGCGGERWCDAVGSGDGRVRHDTVGAATQRGGEWSAGTTWWGAMARRSGERSVDAGEVGFSNEVDDFIHSARGF
jgi:hypothetical protein